MTNANTKTSKKNTNTHPKMIAKEINSIANIKSSNNNEFPLITPENFGSFLVSFAQMAEKVGEDYKKKMKTGKHGLIVGFKCMISELHLFGDVMSCAMVSLQETTGSDGMKTHALLLCGDPNPKKIDVWIGLGQTQAQFLEHCEEKTIREVASGELVEC
jgi:hypothetical protein